MKKWILGITGMPGSGKSTAVDFLAQKGFNVIRFGDITREELQKRNWMINEQNEKEIRNNLRQQYGKGAYAILSLEKIKILLNQTSKIVIDGIYSWEEVEILKKEFSFFYVCAMVADKWLRYQRLAKRKVRPLLSKEAESRDYDEIYRLNKAPTLALADYFIDNNFQSKKKLYKNIEKLLEKIEERDATQLA